MGIVVAEVRFEGTAPAAPAIAAQVAALAGLPTHFTDHLTSPSDAHPPLHDLHIDLAFTAFPKHTIELTAYRPGAVADNVARAGMASMPLAPFVQGINEPPNTQTVYIQAFHGQEPTLFVTTLLALESLGGRPPRPTAPQLLRDFGPPVTAAELSRRHRRANRKGVATLALLIVTLPITIPMLVISILRHLITLPSRLTEAARHINQLKRTTPPTAAPRQSPPP